MKADPETDATTEPTQQERPFLRIDYVTRNGDGRIIDTTDPKVAADSDLAELEASGPVVVVPGEGHLFDPVEATIRNVDPGMNVEVTVDPEDAFGRVDPEAMTTVAKNTIAPEHRTAGKTVQFGGRRGVIEAVSSDTVTVDFNHPLSGIVLEYEIEVLERLEGVETRAEGLTATHGLRNASVDYDRPSKTLTLSFPPGDPDPDRDTRKRAYIAEVSRLLDIASVRVIERYE
ncbi:MAG: hypothetical protein U5K70_04930 [Halodesulfurarchaeum sp.]|nr:hypothetical protein [Halodesulfurarchaeum sp.]